MSFFPSPYLAKLQDLKLWQGNCDSLLLNRNSQSRGSKDFNNVSFPTLDPSEIKSVDWDKKAISPSKPFEQLLEEKLAEDDPLQKINTKPKKPFLRKGSGLQRYKVTPKTKKSPAERTPDAQKTTLGNRKSSIVVVSPRHENCFVAISKSNADNRNKSSQVNVSPLRMPDLTVKPKAVWCGVENEKFADSISPARNDEQLKRKPPLNCNLLEKICEFNRRHCLPNSPATSPRKNKSLCGVLNENGSTVNTKSVLENTPDRELRIFEALEERVEHSSFSSNNSSIFRLLSSSPNKIKLNVLRNAGLEEEKLGRDDYCDDQLQEVYRKQEAFNDFLNSLRKIMEEEQGTAGSTQRKNCSPDSTYSEQGNWSSNAETPSPSPSSFYTDFEHTLKSEMASVVNKVDVAVNTNFSEVDQNVQVLLDCGNCENLMEKLRNLQKEVPNIQAEKARVCDFAKELEKKRDELLRELEKMKRKYDEDVGDLQKDLEAEKKKFAKEKAVFDMYIKESRNRPSKQDREEITNLKKELSDIKELLKLKDTKSGATQARLRNQVKHLEKERDELKRAVDNLQKENSKLNASRKIHRPSEVKMLHEINKNLTKLTEETFRKQTGKSEGAGDNVDMDELRRKSVNCNSGGDDERNNIKGRKTKSCLRERNSQNSGNFQSKIRKYSGDSVDLENEELEKEYEHTFRNFEHQFKSPVRTDNNMNDSKREKTENVFPDGSKEIRYANGNVKTISPDDKLIIMQYYNGDIKETNLSDNTLKYYYSQSATWHTQFGDGSELLEYSNGQKEKKYSDGKREVTCPDGTFLTKLPDGTEEVLYPDGTKMVKNPSGEKILLLPNGQKEIHTKDHKRREYPDGTVKILYTDGTQETRYASGRVRVKDANGILLMDSQN